MKLTELIDKLREVVAEEGDGELVNVSWRGQWVVEGRLDSGNLVDPGYGTEVSRFKVGR